MASASRVEWSDIAKAFAVMLVVWNHAATGITQLQLPAGVDWVTGFVHHFNLASFFLVAGLFACKSVKKPGGDYAWGMFRLVYYPMVLWSILQGTLYALGGAHVAVPTPIWEPLLTSWYDPHKQMNFLLSLLVARFLFFGADRIGVEWWGMGLFAVAGVLAYGAMWANPPDIPLKPDSLLWMVLGAGVTALAGLAWIDRASKWIFLALSVATMATAVALFQIWPKPTSNYYTLVLVRFFGMAGVVTFAIFLSKLGPMRLLVYIGQHSLPIFLAHLVFTGTLRIVLVRFVGMQDALTVAIICFTVGLVAPLALYKMVGKAWIFELPDRLRPRRWVAP